jgi:2-polyprenyl-3-methyl-5-hydroxy-6-metoxy-1,4-benzoquinol methylase
MSKHEADTRPDELVALQETLYTSRNPTRRWLHTSRKAWIEAQIAAAGPGRSALEVGPGSGVYLPALLKAFEKVSAVDIERAHLDHLGPRFPEVRLIEADVTAPIDSMGTFDFVLCSEVVEHIPDSAAALRGIASLLEPGGTLVLSTPQRYSPLELASKIAFLPGVVSIVRAIYREPVLKQGHINLMTRRTVRRQLAEAGFRIRAEHLSGMYVPLVAEFGGRPGLAAARALERIVQDSPLSGLLWTQYYVATRV